jgi:hypothetical protein
LIKQAIDGGLAMSAWNGRNWFDASMDAWSLGMEAYLVAGMRIARMWGGGAKARHEAGLMVREKITAATELQAQLMRSPFTLTPLSVTNRSVTHYRRKVAANKRRLSL